MTVRTFRPPGARRVIAHGRTQQLGREAAAIQRGDDLVGVDSVSRLDRELEHRGLDRDVAEEPLMRDFDDVAAGLADDRRHLAERARHVADLDAQAREPPAAHEAAEQDRGEHPGIDVAAGEHDADPVPRTAPDAG